MPKVVGEIGYGRGVETIPLGQVFEVEDEEAERLVASGYFRLVSDAADEAKPDKGETTRRKAK
jgi:hypothetical protein